jgi:DNA-binding transcriptional LysR family regulator
LNISGVDLNLLVAFDALMEHRNVTRAARAIGLSQPAMSNALSRLRDLFADQLLVRSGPGMSPTPRALEAHGAVRDALAAIGGVLGKVENFDPARDTRRFRVAFAEDAAFYLLPTLSARIAATPGIDLDVLSTAHVAGVELVLNGAAEASVGLIPKSPPKELRFQTVFRERLVAVAREGHPAFKKDKVHPALKTGPAGSKAGYPYKVSLKDFLAYPHVAVRPSVDALSRVDMALAKVGKRRRVALLAPHFMVAPYLIPGTDIIACLAERLARRIAPEIGLVIAEPPVPIPAHDACLAWHRRFDQDRGHMWLRDTIIAEGRGLD